MSSDRIEREIEIEAPIDVVWEVVTRPEHITTWFTDAADLDLRPGGDGRFEWTVKARHRHTVVNVRVVEVEPPRFFSFRWNYPDGAEPDETNAPLVEFALEATGDESTRLHLVESGIAGLAQPEEARETYFTEHTSGWDTIVARLRTYAEERSGAVR